MKHYIGRNLIQDTSDEWGPWVQMPKNKYNAYLGSYRFSVTIEEPGIYSVYYEVELRNVDIDWDAVERDGMSREGIFWTYDFGVDYSLFNNPGRVIIYKGEEFNGIHIGAYVCNPTVGEHVLVFGCHHFNSGEMRIRRMKISPGPAIYSWTPSIESGKLDFIQTNLINDTDNQWSEWITHPTGKANTKTLFYKDILVDINAGDEFTSYVEIEYDNLTFLNEGEGELNPSANYQERSYSIASQGTVDGNWDNDPKSPIFALVYEHGPGLVLNGVKSYTKRMTSEISSKNLWFYIRIDNVKSGRYRIRKALLKRENLINPLWCKSEMDIANPNLLTNFCLYEDGTFSKLYTDTFGGHETQINNAPNPYIGKGWRLYNDRLMKNEVLLIGHYSFQPEKTYTISAYFRAVNENVPLTMTCWCSDGTSADNPDRLSATFHKSFTIANDKWTRYSLTLTVPDYTKYVDFHLVFGNNGEAECCGVKVEEGVAATAWVPGNTNYVDLSRNIINGTSNEWSEWITPKYGVANVAYNLYADVRCSMHKGEEYTSIIEIEYDNLTFLDDGEGQADALGRTLYMVYSQSSVNGIWGQSIIEPWGYLVNERDLGGKTLNGVKRYVSRKTITADIARLDPGIRLDNIKSGRFRYRCAAIKRGWIESPVWTKSLMDETNPNLAYEYEITDDYTNIKKITTDVPNPYIDTVYEIEYHEPFVGSIGWCSVLPYKELIGQVTLSFWARSFVPDVQIRFGNDQWYQESPRLNTKNFDVDTIVLPGDGIWRRYVKTMFIEDVSEDYVFENKPNQYGVPYIIYVRNTAEDIGKPFQMCGPKVEAGNIVTAWVPESGVRATEWGPLDKTVTYSVKADSFGTLWCPFEFKLPPNLIGYRMKFSDTGEKIVTIEQYDDVVPAGIPVVLENESDEDISGTVAGTPVVFPDIEGFYYDELGSAIGSGKDKTIYAAEFMNGEYNIYAMSGGSLVQALNSMNIKANRCFFIRKKSEMQQ